MFCIRCGKDAVRGNFCSSCFLDRNSLFDIEPRILVYFCEMCGSHRVKDKVIVIDELMKSMIKTRGKINEISISKKTKGNTILASVTCAGSISGMPKKETKKTCITIKRRKCQNCVKISGNYHEAVIQVRGEKKERIISVLERILNPGNVAGVMKVKNGYDVRMVDKKKASEIIQRLREKFDVTESYKLVGEKKGAKLYRNYYAVR